MEREELKVNVSLVLSLVADRFMQQLAVMRLH